jgi:integrase
VPKEQLDLTDVDPLSSKWVAKLWRLSRARDHRHTFAVRALQACPDGRDAITQHMLALSTYLGHFTVAGTYWYLEAVPELMTDIADRCE